MRGGALNASFGSLGKATCHWGVVQDDRNGGRKKSAALGDVADGDRGGLRPFAGGLGRAARVQAGVFLIGFESADSMGSLNSSLLLADTPGR